MSLIGELFNHGFVIELAGIDTGEKCLKCKAPFKSLATLNGKINFGDSCVTKCGVWHRVKRLIGKFKVKGKFDINTPTCVTGPRGTSFTIEVVNDGTTLVAVSEGEVEVVDKTYLRSTAVCAGQQITITPKKLPAEPQNANKELLDELAKWRKNITDDVDELEIPENTVIEIPEGKINCASL